MAGLVGLAWPGRAGWQVVGTFLGFQALNPHTFGGPWIDLLLRHSDLIADKNFLGAGALQSWLGFKGDDVRCCGGRLLCNGYVGEKNRKGKKKADLLLIYPLGGYCNEWPDEVHIVTIARQMKSNQRRFG